jgi:hypothetical protein
VRKGKKNSIEFGVRQGKIKQNRGFSTKRKSRPGWAGAELSGAVTKLVIVI